MNACRHLLLLGVLAGLAGCMPASTSAASEKATNPRQGVEKLAAELQRSRDAMDVSADWCARRHLIARGFEGVIHEGETFRYVGSLHSGGKTFKIFYYDFNNPLSGHGNHRLLVFTNYCEYLGGYWTDDEPLRVEGETVVFPLDRDLGESFDDRVRFKGGFPPKVAYPNGDYLKFYPF